MSERREINISEYKTIKLSNGKSITIYKMGSNNSNPTNLNKLKVFSKVKEG